MAITAKEFQNNLKEVHIAKMKAIYVDFLSEATLYEQQYQEKEIDCLADQAARDMKIAIKSLERVLGVT